MLGKWFVWLLFVIGSSLPVAIAVISLIGARHEEEWIAESIESMDEPGEDEEVCGIYFTAAIDLGPLALEWHPKRWVSWLILAGVAAAAVGLFLLMHVTTVRE